MLFRAFVFAILNLLLAGPLYAACNKPDPPACAIQTVPFPSDKAADDCRLDMLQFRDRSDGYATCLGQTSADDEKKARADYEDIRIRFNRRARGEFGDTTSGKQTPQ